MNKSKFLKKSLAALLAILMVAAMIPLSAAAEVIGNGETITATTGTLAKGEDDYHWTVTLPYTAGVTSTKITLASDRKNVEFVQITDEGENSLSTGTSCEFDVKDVAVNAPKEVTIELRDQAPEEDADPLLATYYVTVDKEATSADTTVTKATADILIDGDSVTKTYEGVIEGTTITFNNIAWGCVPTNVATTAAANVAVLKVTLAHANDGFVNGSAVDGTTTKPVYVKTFDADNDTVPLVVTAQNGNTTEYTVKFNEATSFTGISVAGVAAEQDTTDPTKWTATVDAEDVDATAAARDTNKGIKIKATAPKRIVTIDYKSSGSAQTGDTFGYGTAITADETNSSVVAITDNKGNTATAQLTIKLAKNSDTSIKSFAVSDGEYVEQGNVSTMTVNMKKGTTNNSLNKLDAAGSTDVNGYYGVVTFNFKGTMKSVALNGTPLTYLDEDGAVTTGAVGSNPIVSATNNNSDLDSASVVTPLKVNNNTLVVVAEDGTQKTYNLNVAVDKNQTTNPSITGATLKIPAASPAPEETLTATKIDQTNKVIEFTVPASLVTRADTALGTAANLTFTPSAHSAPGSLNKYAKETVNAGKTTYPAITNGEVYAASASTEQTTKYTSFFAPASGGLFEKAADASHPGVAYTLMHSVQVTSDGNSTDGVWYKVYFKAAAPNAVTRLTNIKFYDAASESEVTADNTYEGKSNDVAGTVTIDKTLPYKLYTDPATLAVSYTLGGSRARIFWIDENDKFNALTKSGFDKKGRPQTGGTITGAQLADAKGIVVISEAGADINIIVAGTGASDTVLNDNWKNTNDGKFKFYEFKKTKGDASTLNQLISLKSANGEVSAVINGFNVNLIVPPTYVVKDSETEFDLVAEISENAELYKNAITPNTNKSDVDDPVTFENAKVVENTDGTYSLNIGGAVTTFVVKAQNGTVANYAVSVTVAELDGNADVSSITADGVAATEGEDDAWTVELPYGTDLEAVEVVATPASDKAEAAVVKNDDGTYTITVTAERGNIKTYTLTVTVADEPAAPEFDDVPSWAQDAVNAVAAEGWMLGIGNNKFGPNGNIRRGDFALTIARILEEDWANVSADYAKDVFTDVKEGDWYYEAVAYIAEMGIMSGRGNGFDPRTGITREEAAKVMCLAMDLEPIEGETIFGDNASIAGWAKPYVNACQKAGVFNGTNGNFNPKDQLTRAQAAQIFKNGFIDYQPEDTTPDEPAE